MSAAAASSRSLHRRILSGTDFSSSSGFRGLQVPAFAATACYRKNGKPPQQRPMFALIGRELGEFAGHLPATKEAEATLVSWREQSERNPELTRRGINRRIQGDYSNRRNPPTLCRPDPRGLRTWTRHNIARLQAARSERADFLSDSVNIGLHDVAPTLVDLRVRPPRSDAEGKGTFRGRWPTNGPVR